METQTRTIRQNEGPLRQEAVLSEKQTVKTIEPKEKKADPLKGDHFFCGKSKLPAHLGGGTSLKAAPSVPDASATPSLEDLAAEAPKSETLKLDDATAALSSPLDSGAAASGSAGEAKDLYDLMKEVYRDAYNFGKWLDGYVKEATGRPLTEHIADGFEAAERGIKAGIEVAGEGLEKLGEVVETVPEKIGTGVEGMKKGLEEAGEFIGSGLEKAGEFLKDTFVEEKGFKKMGKLKK